MVTPTLTRFSQSSDDAVVWAALLPNLEVNLQKKKHKTKLFDVLMFCILWRRCQSPAESFMQYFPACNNTTVALSVHESGDLGVVILEAGWLSALRHWFIDTHSNKRARMKCIILRRSLYAPSSLFRYLQRFFAQQFLHYCVERGRRERRNFVHSSRKSFIIEYLRAFSLGLLQRRKRQSRRAADSLFRKKITLKCHFLLLWFLYLLWSPINLVQYLCSIHNSLRYLVAHHFDVY